MSELQEAYPKAPSGGASTSEGASVAGSSTPETDGEKMAERLLQSIEAIYGPSQRGNTPSTLPADVTPEVQPLRLRVCSYGLSQGAAEAMLWNGEVSLVGKPAKSLPYGLWVFLRVDECPVALKPGELVFVEAVL